MVMQQCGEQSDSERERERERECKRRRETGIDEETEDRGLPAEDTHNNSGDFAVKQGEHSYSDEEDGPEAFEDNPMPILQGAIRISDEDLKVKILKVLAKAINLISRGTADRLVIVGAKIAREGNLRIKVASGNESSLMRLSRSQSAWVVSGPIPLIFSF